MFELNFIVPFFREQIVFPVWSGEDFSVFDLQFVNFLLSSHLPKIYQSFLMSATFTEDVQALKELLLHNPVSCPVELPGPLEAAGPGDNVVLR